MSTTPIRNNQTQEPQNIVGRGVSMTERVIRNAHKVAIPAIALAGLASIPGVEGGFLSGTIVAVGCFGAAALYPANLFWAAAPCAELTMIATANPLIP